MKKGNNFISFIFALVAIGGAILAISAYIKSKKAAKEIREDFLADLGYEFDDSGCYCGDESDCDCGEGCQCEHHTEHESSEDTEE